MRQLTASIGRKHNAKIIKVWRGDFPTFCKSLLSRVPETEDKASNGWVSGAEFSPSYRDSENFVARHFVSLDYDHITPADQARILDHFKGTARLCYTTWSHTAANPRLRIWLPTSREIGYDEFQAVSRRVAADIGIELAARESHTVAQYMYRPAIKPFEEFWSESDTESPWIDVDATLSRFDNWTDRSQWPCRREADELHNGGRGVSPLDKKGIVGAFCRAFTIEEAIARFELPYDKVS